VRTEALYPFFFCFGLEMQLERTMMELVVFFAVAVTSIAHIRLLI
jgi:hypothetical protein